METDNGNEFVNLLNEKGITRKELADALGVTERSVYRWLSGKAIPMLTVSQMKVLCAFLDKPLEEIPDNWSAKNS